ncbi:putative bifunctional diguanylate cyclase/phosphodiesterase [Kineococcus glutinatus]|uniref:PAS domain S-box-containing protein/diguanylate cyclase (GGDEF)-like protein n=1 Tax=Kineococcus glutinatus TaxID=1070872 RepID=A0ABP9HYU9_9ACTN
MTEAPEALRALALGALAHPRDAAVVYRPVHAPDGRTVDFTYELLNAPAERMLGVSGARGRTVGEVLVDAAPPVLERCRTVLGTGRPWWGLVQLHSAEDPRWDGRWYEWHLVPVEDRLVGRFRDVTAEREAAAAATASAHLARAIVEHAADVVQIYDAQGYTTYASPAMERILGWDGEEVVGMHYRDLIDAEFHAFGDEAFAAALADPPDTVREIDVYVVHKDGSRRWAEARLSNQLHDPAIRGVLVNWRDVTGQRRMREDLEHQALHDPLTALPNRRLFDDHLALALAHTARTGEPVAVVFVDLDHFKLVNDTFGHPVGDRLLVETADRLRRVLRPGDTVARFGGDEFVLLLQDLHRSMDIATVLRRVMDAVTGARTVDGHDLHVSVSVGASVCAGTRGAAVTGDQLLSEADTAMYEAKRRGRNRFQVFSSQLRTDIEHRMRTESGLRRALAGDELTVLYQPVLDLPSGAVSGAEALLRWDDPAGRRIGPDEFLGVAEETGLIVDIGAGVLRAACARGAQWDAAGLPLTVAVNLSARELVAPGLVAGVVAALDASGLDPRRLELEITETTVLADLPAARRTLEALREMGIGIALDDFGTGYSSLTWLQQLPADTVKLDRSFITHLCRSAQDEAIVSAVITLAHALGLRVVGEGVETAQQLQVLRRLGCDHAQGFHLGRPLAADDLTALLHA